MPRSERTGLLHSASGDFHCDLPTTQTGKTYLYGDGSARIQVSCISGDLTVQLANSAG